MADSILVAYATIHGSTKEVAEAVAETLREAGLQADARPLRDVRTLTEYGAAVIGAPLYMFRWHKDARRFIPRHREALTEKPVAVFALGPFNNEESEFQGAREQLDKALVKFPWLSPVAIQVFGGKFDPAGLRFPYNLIPAMKQLPVTDIRDWEAIRAWASDLAARF